MNVLRRGFCTPGLLVLLCVSRVLPVAASDESPQVGTIQGRLTFRGDIPPRRPLIEVGQAPRDESICASKRSIPDDSLLIDKESRGVANAFIWMLRKPQGYRSEPTVLAAEDEPAFIGCRLVPHAQVFHTKQKIKVRGESVVHNVHTHALANPHP